MPLIIPKELPAFDELSRENVFVMHRERAQSQHIRPLRILILNLMPTKIVTETQLARLLSPSRSSRASNSPVEAPLGAAPRPMVPSASQTSASTVGLPRESMISRPMTFSISR